MPSRPLEKPVSPVMRESVIEVVAPSRLHFGLLSFGRPDGRQFGGAGVMIDEPGMKLRISPADRFEVLGPLAERARAVAERYGRLKELSGLPACRIEIVNAPPEHLGLGTGTQLALSVVAGLHAFAHESADALTPESLAVLSGRAARSAIGTYGFVQGGLLADAGKLAGEALGTLEMRVETPSTWRFVLICPQQERGLSGEDERRAFRDLPPVSRETTTAMHDELFQELMPAAAAGQFDRFSESLYRFGTTAGTCYVTRQGGTFANPRMAELVRSIRGFGISGVAQTSWGPTIFAVVESESAANDLRQRLQPNLDPHDAIIISSPNNSGATISGKSLPGS